MHGDGALFAFLEELLGEAVAPHGRVNHCHEHASAHGEEWSAGVPSGELGKSVFGPSLLEHRVEFGKLGRCHAGVEEGTEVVMRLAEVDGVMVSTIGRWGSSFLV